MDRTNNSKHLPTNRYYFAKKQPTGSSKLLTLSDSLSIPSDDATASVTNTSSLVPTPTNAADVQPTPTPIQPPHSSSNPPPSTISTTATPKKHQPSRHFTLNPRPPTIPCTASNPSQSHQKHPQLFTGTAIKTIKKVRTSIDDEFGEDDAIVTPYPLGQATPLKTSQLPPSDLKLFDNDDDDPDLCSPEPAPASTGGWFGSLYNAVTSTVSYMTGNTPKTTPVSTPALGPAGSPKGRGGGTPRSRAERLAANNPNYLEPLRLSSHSSNTSFSLGNPLTPTTSAREPVLQCTPVRAPSPLLAHASFDTTLLNTPTQQSHSLLHGHKNLTPHPMAHGTTNNTKTTTLHPDPGLSTPILSSRPSSTPNIGARAYPKQHEFLPPQDPQDGGDTPTLSKTSRHVQRLRQVNQQYTPAISYSSQRDRRLTPSIGAHNLDADGPKYNGIVYPSQSPANGHYTEGGTSLLNGTGGYALQRGGSAIYNSPTGPAQFPKPVNSTSPSQDYQNSTILKAKQQIYQYEQYISRQEFVHGIHQVNQSCGYLMELQPSSQRQHLSQGHRYKPDDIDDDFHDNSGANETLPINSNTDASTLDGHLNSPTLFDNEQDFYENIDGTPILPLPELNIDQKHTKSAKNAFPSLVLDLPSDNDITDTIIGLHTPIIKKRPADPSLIPLNPYLPTSPNPSASYLPVTPVAPPTDVDINYILPDQDCVLDHNTLWQHYNYASRRPQEQIIDLLSNLKAIPAPITTIIQQALFTKYQIWVENVLLCIFERLAGSYNLSTFQLKNHCTVLSRQYKTCCDHFNDYIILLEQRIARLEEDNISAIPLHTITVKKTATSPLIQSPTPTESNQPPPPTPTLSRNDIIHDNDLDVLNFSFTTIYELQAALKAKKTVLLSPEQQMDEVTRGKLVESNATKELFCKTHQIPLTSQHYIPMCRAKIDKINELLDNLTLAYREWCDDVHSYQLQRYEETIQTLPLLCTDIVKIVVTAFIFKLLQFVYIYYRQLYIMDSKVSPDGDRIRMLINRNTVKIHDILLTKVSDVLLPKQGSVLSNLPAGNGVNQVALKEHYQWSTLYQPNQQQMHDHHLDWYRQADPMHITDPFEYISSIRCSETIVIDQLEMGMQPLPLSQLKEIYKSMYETSNPTQPLINNIYNATASPQPPKRPSPTTNINYKLSWIDTIPSALHCVYEDIIKKELLGHWIEMIEMYYECQHYKGDDEIFTQFPLDIESCFLAIKAGVYDIQITYYGLFNKQYKTQIELDTFKTTVSNNRARSRKISSERIPRKASPSPSLRQISTLQHIQDEINGTDHLSTPVNQSPDPRHATAHGPSRYEVILSTPTIRAITTTDTRRDNHQLLLVPHQYSQPRTSMDVHDAVLAYEQSFLNTNGLQIRQFVKYHDKDVDNVAETHTKAKYAYGGVVDYSKLSLHHRVYQKFVSTPVAPRWLCLDTAPIKSQLKRHQIWLSAKLTALRRVINTTFIAKYYNFIAGGDLPPEQNPVYQLQKQAAAFKTLEEEDDGVNDTVGWSWEREILSNYAHDTVINLLCLIHPEAIYAPRYMTELVRGNYGLRTTNALGIVIARLLTLLPIEFIDFLLLSYPEVIYEHVFSLYRIKDYQVRLQHAAVPQDAEEPIALPFIESSDFCYASYHGSQQQDTVLAQFSLKFTSLELYDYVEYALTVRIVMKQCYILLNDDLGLDTIKQEVAQQIAEDSGFLYRYCTTLKNKKTSNFRLITHNFEKKTVSQENCEIYDQHTPKKSETLQVSSKSKIPDTFEKEPTLPLKLLQYLTKYHTNGVISVEDIDSAITSARNGIITTTEVVTKQAAQAFLRDMVIKQHITAQKNTLLTETRKLIRSYKHDIVPTRALQLIPQRFDDLTPQLLNHPCQTETNWKPTQQSPTFLTLIVTNPREALMRTIDTQHYITKSTLAQSRAYLNLPHTPYMSVDFTKLLTSLSRRTKTPLFTLPLPPLAYSKLFSPQTIEKPLTNEQINQIVWVSAHPQLQYLSSIYKTYNTPREFINISHQSTPKHHKIDLLYTSLLSKESFYAELTGNITSIPHLECLFFNQYHSSYANTVGALCDALYSSVQKAISAISPETHSFEQLGYITRQQRLGTQQRDMFVTELSSLLERRRVWLKEWLITQFEANVFTMPVLEPLYIDEAPLPIHHDKDRVIINKKRLDEIYKRTPPDDDAQYYYLDELYHKELTLSGQDVHQLPLYKLPMEKVDEMGYPSCKPGLVVHHHIADLLASQYSPDIFPNPFELERTEQLGAPKIKHRAKWCWVAQERLDQGMVRFGLNPKYIHRQPQYYSEQQRALFDVSSNSDILALISKNSTYSISTDNGLDHRFNANLSELLPTHFNLAATPSLKSHVFDFIDCIIAYWIEMDAKLVSYTTNALTTGIEMNDRYTQIYDNPLFLADDGSDNEEDTEFPISDYVMGLTRNPLPHLLYSKSNVFNSIVIPVTNAMTLETDSLYHGLRPFHTQFLRKQYDYIIKHMRESGDIEEDEECEEVSSPFTMVDLTKPEAQYVYMFDVIDAVARTMVQQSPAYLSRIIPRFYNPVTNQYSTTSSPFHQPVDPSHPHFHEIDGAYRLSQQFYNTLRTTQSEKLVGELSVPIQDRIFTTPDPLRMSEQSRFITQYICPIYRLDRHDLDSHSWLRLTRYNQKRHHKIVTSQAELDRCRSIYNQYKVQYPYASNLRKIDDSNLITAQFIFFSRPRMNFLMPSNFCFSDELNPHLSLHWHPEHLEQSVQITERFDQQYFITEQAITTGQLDKQIKRLTASNHHVNAIRAQLSANKNTTSGLNKNSCPE